MHYNKVIVGLYLWWLKKESRSPLLYTIKPEADLNRGPQTPPPRGK